AASDVYKRQLLGEKGLRALAKVNHKTTQTLKAGLSGIAGVDVLNDSFFNELTVRLPKGAAGVVEELAKGGVLAGVPFSRLDPNAGHDDLLVLAATEMVTDEDIAALVSALTEAVQ
ncbi:MAG: glycine dehydrogenase, partial [Kordiimonadaceae bacterium]|nr:glycine dehydrogenase [Kordiimonadaceae bacterium]